jgi:hemin uptake protein HemP
VPIPTVTGADPSRLSVIFDEVTVKERLVVEGGKSNQQLSQFDGPVSFNEDVNIFNNVKISPTNSDDKESFDSSTGALVVDGGVGIAGTVNIGAGSSIFLPDNTSLLFGNDKDLSIVHDGNNSFIDDSGQGNLYIRGSNIVHLQSAGGEDGVKVISDGAVELYHDSIKRFNTTSSGAIVTGILTATGNLSLPTGSVTAATFFGDGAGLTNTGATLSAGSGTQRLVLTSLTSAQMTSAATDSALTYNSSEDVLNTGKLNVSGISTFNNQVFLPDGVKIEFGGASSNSDMEIVHDGANSVMRETGAGNLYLQSDQVVYITKTDGATVMGEFSGTGASKLRWNGAGAGQRFETTQTGAKVTGALDVTDDITAFSTSDKRLKNNISPIKQALDKVKSISGNTFDWNDLSNKNGSEVGVIAQEIEALNLPGITSVREDGTLAVRYEKLVPVLIEAVKELSSKVTALENKINN